MHRRVLEWLGGCVECFSYSARFAISRMRIGSYISPIRVARTLLSAGLSFALVIQALVNMDVAVRPWSGLETVAARKLFGCRNFCILIIAYGGNLIV